MYAAVVNDDGRQRLISKLILLKVVLGFLVFVFLSFSRHVGIFTLFTSKGDSLHLVLWLTCWSLIN